MKRLDRSELLAILQNPEQRRQLLAGSVRFIQAVEGRDISLERAMEVVDMAVKRELEGDALVRRVRVDMGYGPAEHWVTAKVINQRTCQALFGDGTTTDLLVELPGGKRTWVSFWEEIDDADGGVTENHPRSPRL